MCSCNFGSETIICFMQLHFPYFSWDSFQYAFAAFKIIGIIYFMRLQFWRFSELILHKFLGGGYPGVEKISQNLAAVFSSSG